MVTSLLDCYHWQEPTYSRHIMAAHLACGRHSEAMQRAEVVLRTSDRPRDIFRDRQLVSLCRKSWTPAPGDHGRSAAAVAAANRNAARLEALLLVVRDIRHTGTTLEVTCVPRAVWSAAEE
jgi:hypothetical protein